LDQNPTLLNYSTTQPCYKDSEANHIASQPYLAHVAARGVIIIDTENEDIGSFQLEWWISQVLI